MKIILKNNNSKNIISSIDNDKDHVMHWKIDSKEIVINDEVVEVAEELFDSVKNRYQNNLELMKGSQFAFEYFHLLYYECHKINPDCGRPYIDSPDWMKNKKSNKKDKKDNKCFQYVQTVALNHAEIGKNSEIITKFKPSINKYNWEGMHFPSEKDY